MGWWRAGAATLLLAGCGISKSEWRPSGSAPPLEERPSELQRWVLLTSTRGSTIVEFNQLLAPRSITLTTGAELGVAAISPGATKLAYPVRQTDSWGVEVVESADFTTPIQEWSRVPLPPTLSWVGGQRLLAATGHDVTSALQVLDPGTPTPLASFTLASVVATGANAVVLHALDGIVYVGASGELLPIALANPLVSVGVSEDGTRLALVSSSVLSPPTLDGVSVDTVHWVPPPPPNCPHADSPSCELAPASVTIDRVAYSPDESEVLVESSSTEGAQLARAAITPPIEILQGSGDPIARSYLGRQWGYLDDGRLYLAPNEYAGEDSGDRDSHRLVVGGRPGIKLPGVATGVVPSGDQRWLFVSVRIPDPKGGPGEHTVEATFLETFPDEPPREIFRSGTADRFVVPSPVGSELLLGIQDYGDDGSYCTTLPRTDCDGIRYYLVSDEGGHGELVPDVQGPLWTPDGQGIVGERHGKLGYVPHDAPEQFYELAEGSHLTLRMPSQWQQAP